MSVSHELLWILPLNRSHLREKFGISYKSSEMSLFGICTPEQCTHAALRDLFKNIQRNIIHNSSQLEMTQMSIRAKWMCISWHMHAMSSKKHSIKWTKGTFSSRMIRKLNVEIKKQNKKEYINKVLKKQINWCYKSALWLLSLRREFTMIGKIIMAVSGLLALY